MLFRSKIIMMPNITEIRKDVIVTIFTEKLAALGFPAPSSLLTLTLAAALKPTEIMNNHPKIDIHIESESNAISGSSKRPANRTNIWKYHVSKHNMTAEAAESFKKDGKPWKASSEKPDHVYLHLGDLMIYTNWAMTTIHHDKLSTNAAPKIPHPSL